MRGTLLAALALAAGSAAAHTGGRGFVMLLPTGLYMLGGALVVALSFAVWATLPSRAFARAVSLRLPLAEWRRVPLLAPSGFALALLVALIYAGFTGTRDPLDNPLPPFVWSLWWIGFTCAVALFGDLWRAVNPWRALYRLATAPAPLAILRRRPPIAYPPRLGVWPAVALLFAFAWYELIYPAPMDPGILAAACTGYALLTLAGMLAFGEAAWLANAEAFSVYFGLVGRLSPLAAEHRPRGLRVSIGMPCAGLLCAQTLERGMAAFVLLALASVSFDGLSLSFWWLARVGANPLEFPGRTSLVGVNTLGLAGAWGALAAVYAIAVRAGSAIAGGARAAMPGRYVVAIVPIAFAYHFAHYLPLLLVEGQHALRALSDPFARGWNLIGFRDWHVTASFLERHETVHVIWNLQVAAIVLGHVAAIGVAHAIALREFGQARLALASQLPMTALMIGYTVFGLWLLSTPVAG